VISLLVLGIACLAVGIYSVFKPSTNAEPTTQADQIQTTVQTTAQPAQKVLVVLMSTPWTEAHLEVKTGEKLIVSATGRGVWKSVAPSSPNAQPNPHEECGPDGTGPVHREDYYSNIASYQCPNAFKGALIGKIGEYGVPFPVGSKFSHMMKDAGPLYLGINDQKADYGSDNWADNSGAFTVHIRIEPQERR